MRIHSLEKRLRKLECTLRCEPDDFTDAVFALLWFGVAYYLGKPTPNERPFSAYARVLGYATESALNAAIERKDRELPTRFLDAEDKLFAKFGYDRGPDSNEELKALKPILDGLPRSYRNQMDAVLTRAKISLHWMRNQSRDIGAYIRLFA